ncbi:MAG TPA: ELWxxDGT repeat protein [Gemmataceae bacterium]|nr:ELWxxDGT repeat protein [Gemmataceae bacterium]
MPFAWGVRRRGQVGRTAEARRRPVRPRVEALEARALPSVTLVKDINRDAAPSLPLTDSEQVDITAANGKLFFVANDGTHGNELWASDGTAAGTAPVRDRQGHHLAGPLKLTAVGNTLYVTAEGGATGEELWRTDGTAAGTVRVKTLSAGPGTTAQAADLTAVGGTLYFTTSDPSGTQTDLWRSDGTTAGTFVLHAFDIPVGGATAGDLQFTSWKDRLYCLADNGGHRAAVLWQSDGTVAGTTPIKDLDPAQDNVTPSNLTVVNGRLFFALTDNDTRREALWSSDGTAAGTRLVKTLTAATAALSPFVAPAEFLTPVGNTLFFTADDGVHGTELWKSDGSARGTVLVKDINAQPTPPGTGAAGSDPASLTAVGHTLFFSASDGVHGDELWKSDGSPGGTVLVKDINPAAGAPTDEIGDGTSSFPSSLVAVGGRLFFTASDPTHGNELWRSDGTAAGTSLVRDIHPGFADSAPTGLTALNGRLFFAADDGTHGLTLWKSDGTAAGTGLVRVINRSTADAWPADLTAVNGKVFFTADDGTHGRQLWRTGGSASGAVMLTDLPGGGSVANLTASRGLLFFTANDGMHGDELWRSDGTAAGTRMVKDLYRGTGPAYPGGPLGPNSSNPTDLTDVNGTLFFVGADGQGGPGLWASDGTAAGTRLVRRFVADPASGGPTNLTDVNGTLFFAASDGVHGQELWKSKGTTATTVMVKDIWPGAVSLLPGMPALPFSSAPANFFVAGSTLYFTANDGSHGTELWKSDGTAKGTVLVKDANPGSGDAFSDLLGMAPSFATMNGVLYFTANDGVHGPQLWRTDGTPGGTRLVKAIGPGMPGEVPASLTVVGHTLFFSADDGVHGQELWKSDGTARGTVLVKDIWPGTGGPPLFPGGPPVQNSSYPSNLIAFNGKLLFTANDSVHGTGLWQSDGSSAGTHLVSGFGSLNVGYGMPDDGGPAILRMGNTLYFSASDAPHGIELWKYTP